MAQVQEESKSWEGDLLDSPYMQHIIRLVCCRSLSTEKCYDALFGMVETLQDTKLVKEAMFYLEHANWNASEAFVQKELDCQDRRGPALDGEGNPVDNCAANLRLDRSFAKPGDDYKVELCQIDVVVGGQESTFSYPHADSVNHDSQADINALNRWRHKIIRENVGLLTSSNQNGIEYHPLQIQYLLNRYSEQEIDFRGRANYAEIANDHNAVFEGVLLPGRTAACEARTRDSVTSLLTRKAVNPPGPRGWPKNYNGVMRHAAAQAKIKKEWSERLQANDERDMEEANALEESESSSGSDEED